VDDRGVRRNAVRAHIVACGSCEDRNNWHGYMSKLPDSLAEEAASLTNEERREFLSAHGDDLLVSPPMGSSWTPISDDKGIELLLSLESVCEDEQQRVVCWPE